MPSSRASKDTPKEPSARKGRGILTLLLALYSAGVSTVLLMRPAPQPARGGAAAQGGASEDRLSELHRQVRTEVKIDLEGAVKDAKEQLARAVKQVEEARDSFKAVGDMQAKRTDELARTASTRVDGLDERLDDVVKDQKAMRATLDGLALAVKELQSRPAVLGPVAVRAPDPKPTETKPVDPEPAGPTKEQIAANKEKVRAAIAELSSTDIAKVFPACSYLGNSGDLEAVEPLLKVLKEFKDPFGRTAAAAALGTLHACDAVPALLAAFSDKDPGVFLAAGGAFGRIAGGIDAQLAGDSKKSERAEKRDQWTKWWAIHEPEIRKRWNQEGKAGDAPPAPEPGMDK